MYRANNHQTVEVLLVHPGGPFWKNKDEGAWSLPKGEYTSADDALAAAKREFVEETGIELPPGEFIPLQPIKIKSDKLITAWAIEAALDVSEIKSNTFEMEWPPRSGKKQVFPEIDKAGWFTMDEAKLKINAGQAGFLQQLIAVIQR